MSKKKIAVIVCFVAFIAVMIITSDIRYINRMNKMFEESIGENSINLSHVELFMDKCYDERFSDVVNSERFQNNLDRVFSLNVGYVVRFLEVLDKYDIEIPSIDERVQSYLDGIFSSEDVK